MTFEQVQRKIIDHFKALWTLPAPVAFPNKREDFGDVDIFARVKISFTGGRHVAVGRLKHRRRGVVLVQIFVRQNTGVEDLAALEEIVTRMFTRHTLSGVRFFDVGPADRAGEDGYGYYQSNVNAAFTFDTN